MGRVMFREYMEFCFLGGGWGGVFDCFVFLGGCLVVGGGVVVRRLCFGGGLR